MEVTLEEDSAPKQYIFSNKRKVFQEDENATLAELRILSKDKKYLSQIHPENFDDFRLLLENKLNDGQNNVNLDINIDSMKGSTTDICSFCGEDNPIAINIPVTLNLSSDEIYPALTSGQYRGSMCNSCAEKTLEYIESILNSRKDLLLAHEI